jgi:hypothetical protein
MELLYKEEVFNIIGAAMEVHNVLGTGFLESAGMEVGLLINFGSHGKLEWKRYARSAE